MRRIALVALIVLACSGGDEVPVATAHIFTGASVGAVSRAFPPIDDSWAKQGQLLSPAGWEGTALVEPTVLVDDRWRMWYRGAWPAASEAIGYAECTLGDDPTVSGNWTKYASNPVVGLGAVVADPVALPEVYKLAGIYYMSAVSDPFTVGNAMLFLSSADGLAWSTRAGSISLPSGKDLWGNRVVWHDGSQYQMLAEAGLAASPPWEIYRYTSANGLTWSIANSGNALTSLQVATGGMYGGPSLAGYAGQLLPGAGGKIHLWYHASPSPSSSLPTNIYHATADPSDLDTWTKTSGAVLTHAASGFEVDQVADPSIVMYGGTAYLFYDGDDNTAEAAAIGVATAPLEPR